MPNEITNDSLVSVLDSLANEHAALPYAVQGTHFDSTKVAAPINNTIGNNSPTVITPISDSGKENNTPGKLKITNLSLPDSGEMLRNVNEQITNIQTIEDPIKRQQALMDFQSNIAAFQADTLKKHMDVASSKNNVPLLTQQLTVSRELDKKDPLYHQFKTDSTITRKIQSELDSANARSEAEAGKTLKTDTMLATVLAKADIFTKSQERMINMQVERGEMKTAQADMILGSLNNDTLAWTARLNPLASNDPDKLKQSAVAMVSGANKKEAMQVFDPRITEEDLPALATQGNGIAQKLSTQIQSEKTGMDSNIINKQMRVMQQAALDSTKFDETVKAYPMIMDKKMMTDYSKLKLSATSKEEKDTLIKYRAAVLQRLPSIQNMQQLEGNVDSWPIAPGLPSVASDVELYAALNKIKSVNNGKKVTSSDLLKEYVNSVPKEEQADKLAKFKLIYGGAIDQVNKGIYGNVDKSALLLKMQARSAIFNSLDHSLSQLQGNFSGDNLAPDKNLLVNSPFAEMIKQTF